MPSQLLERDEKGRWVFGRGKYVGEFLDDVVLSDPRYVKWLLGELAPSQKAERDAIEEALP